MVDKLKQGLVARLKENNLNYAPELYHFVLDSILNHVLLERLQGLSTHHLSPARICSLLLSQMQLQFGPLGPQIFKKWGVLGAEDIGSVVFDLADMDCLILQGDEKMGDFIQAGFEI